MKKRRQMHTMLKEAVSKDKWKDFGAVFLIILFLPYLCVTFFGNNRFFKNNIAVGSPWKIEEMSLDKNSFYIKKEVAAGSELIPMEEYLIGLTAGNIPMDVLDETVKAQIIILRTAIVKKGIKKEDYNYVEAMNLSLVYLTNEEMKNLFGVEYAATLDRIKGLIQSTKGIIITYHGSPIEAPFFAISAGTTRDAREVLGSIEYPYLISVNSEKDMFAENYLKIENIKISEFNKLIKIAYPNLKENDEEDNHLVCVEDSAGYILSVQFGDKKLSGEEFRKIFHLNSSSFELIIEENGITITTKGLGHGLGFSQYGGNQLAKDGKGFIEIVKYYYSNVEVEKIE
ncbi:MAG TPA: SpoIID/LytB domain-containing protein [Lachnospiraceae bacterium]|nr:SpoIID/LytB domain-containing protein [Lachnospiraceae bacterium]